LYVSGPGRFLGWMDKRTMRRRAHEELVRLKITIPDVNVIADDLSGGQRQAVAVARTVAWGRKLVMMDEPTASLGVEEQEKVGGLVRTLAEHNLPVLLVSHNIAEVFEIADRIVVLRHGRRVASRSVQETSREEIVGLITGALDGDPIATR
jgi:ABC-type sugar transport system ATPase subunit